MTKEPKVLITTNYHVHDLTQVSAEVVHLRDDLVVLRIHLQKKGLPEITLLVDNTTPEELAEKFLDCLTNAFTAHTDVRDKGY